MTSGTWWSFTHQANYAPNNFQKLHKTVQNVKINRNNRKPATQKTSLYLFWGPRTRGNVATQDSTVLGHTRSHPRSCAALLHPFPPPPNPSSWLYRRACRSCACVPSLLLQRLLFRPKPSLFVSWLMSRHAASQPRSKKSLHKHSPHYWKLFL